MAGKIVRRGSENPPVGRERAGDEAAVRERTDVDTELEPLADEIMDVVVER